MLRSLSLTSLGQALCWAVAGLYSGYPGVSQSNQQGPDKRTCEAEYERPPWEPLLGFFPKQGPT